MPEPGWFDVAGGKLTTYRRIAQQVVDRIVRYQGRKAGPCRTATEPLLPAGPGRDAQRHSCRRRFVPIWSSTIAATNGPCIWTT